MDPARIKLRSSRMGGASKPQVPVRPPFIDLGRTIVVTYTVVAESLQGATGSPVASGSEIVGGETAAPIGSATLPPTASASGSSNGSSTPLFALLICFLLGGIGLIAAQSQRRSLRR